VLSLIAVTRHRPSPAYPVTAYALSNALGATTGEVLAALAEGRSGLAPCRWDLPFPTHCGQWPGELPPMPPALAAYDCRQARLALAGLAQLAPAAERAKARWGADRVGLALGTSTGGIGETEAAFAAWRQEGRLPASFDFARQHSFGALLELVRFATGFEGPGVVVSTACSSSAKVFGVAQRWLDAGLADAVLVGGVDSLCHTTLRGFRSLEVLSAKACRPFAADRDGMNIGEGAALLLLERAGDGPALLLGVGESSDAHHMSHPHPDGEGALAAMSAALAQAALEPSAIDHINAHGTATQLNDAAEAKAIAALFGASVPVASTKGFTGHLLGAAGATEAAFSIAALERGFIPASLGSDPLDPALAIAVSARRLERACRRVLSNSFAFGGNNVSLIFGSPP